MQSSLVGPSAFLLEGDKLLAEARELEKEAMNFEEMTENCKVREKQD